VAIRTRAAAQGGTLESAVKNVLERHRFVVMRYSEWAKDPDKYGGELLLTNAPFTTIYDHPGRTEFLLISERLKRRIRIECKWQQTSGSVDEKLPYLYLNSIEKMPENEIVVIIDGDGWKPGAIRWLKEAIRQKKYDTAGDKIIKVFSIKEFITWANKTFG